MRTSPGKAAVAALVIFLAVIGGILLLLHFLGILILAIAFLGLFLFLGIILAIIVVGLIFILLGPYYMLTKKPVVDQSSSYSLEDVEGKEDRSKTQ